MKTITLGYTNRLFSEGLEILVNRFEGFKVLHSVSNEQLINNMSCLGNGLSGLILELDNPRKSDTQFIESIHNSFPNLAILLLSHSPSPSISMDLIESGISAYMLKSCTSMDLNNALIKMTSGDKYICSAISMKLISDKRKDDKRNALNLLTEREKNILVLLVNNCSTGEVAGKLSISQNTVKTHKRNIQSKLGIHSMIGMLLFAVRNSLVDVGYHDLCNACPHYAEN